MSEFTFGASLGSLEHVAESAQRLEELGFDFATTGEHVMRGNPPGPSTLSLPVLAVAAGATKKIRLVSSILLLPLYHPTLLNKEVTTLDIASGGRVTLGIGVGGEYPREFEVSGVPSRQRGGRADEILEVMHRLWKEENVTHSGRYFQIEDATLLPLPTQRPHPPIWVAGRRDVAMRRAARYGDAWYPYLYSAERYKGSVEKVREFAEEEGRDPATIDMAIYLFLCIYDDKEKAKEVAASRLGGRYLYSGKFSDIVERYCVLGSLQDCISGIERFAEAGARHFNLVWTCESEDTERHIETAVRDIIPYFKGKG